MNANASQNQKWTELLEIAETKREELNFVHRLQKYYIKCHETTKWIEDKIRILQKSTDNSETEPIGIMDSDSLVRDLVATDTKLKFLDQEAESIISDHPEEATTVVLEQITIVWEPLTLMLKEMSTTLDMLCHQARTLQLFRKDAQEVDAILNLQHGILMKFDYSPASVEHAEFEIHSLECLFISMEANDPKLNGLVQLSQRLAQEGHFAAGQIAAHAESIEQRRNTIKKWAFHLMDCLRAQLEYRRCLRYFEEKVDYLQMQGLLERDEDVHSMDIAQSRRV